MSTSTSYSFFEPSQTSTPQSDSDKRNIATIVGGVIGGSVALLLLAAASWYLLHHRRTNLSPPTQMGITADVAMEKSSTTALTYSPRLYVCHNLLIVSLAPVFIPVLILKDPDDPSTYPGASQQVLPVSSSRSGHSRGQNTVQTHSQHDNVIIL